MRPVDEKAAGYLPGCFGAASSFDNSRGKSKVTRDWLAVITLDQM